MDAIFAPMDAARLRALHALGPVARAFIVDRDRRVAFAALLATTTALVLAVGAPMWSIALTPLVLGVPHLVADVRYLVVRPGLHRQRTLVIAAGVPLAIASIGGGLRAALVGVAAALLVASSGSERRAGAHGRRAGAYGFAMSRSALAALAALVPIAYLAWAYPRAVDAAFAQLHNVLALVFWWAWRPRGQRPVWRWAGLAVMVLAATAILSGVLDPLVARGLGWRSHAPGLGVGGLAEALAPGMSTTWALRLVLLFAFGQSVHYGVWLRMVPDEDRPHATPRTFRASFRALRADLGPWLLLAAGLVAVVLIGWGVFDVRAARDGYVRLSAFHGYLELAVLGVGIGRGRIRLQPAA